jgi:hypothetical protein
MEILDKVQRVKSIGRLNVTYKQLSELWRSPWNSPINKKHSQSVLIDWSMFLSD